MELFKKAKQFIPGGVNSPVRSFRSVGGEPIFVKEGKGSKIYDSDGREFLDYCMSWGALILGHAYPEVIKKIKRAVEKGTSFGIPTELEVEFAKEITEAVPSCELVRLTSSGTEAVMSAVRVARGFTRKEKIVKFEGCYHGHADYLLVKAGSGASALGIPDSLGVPEDFTKHTMVLPYNDLEAVASALKTQSKEVAALIVEPVCGNMGVILPEEGFLKGLRELCDQYGVLLIFDEVITGFRLSYGGAQGYFGITPDLTCLGKILGGGLPLGAFGGKKEIMECVAPLGAVYQAGTLSGNPVAVTAGLANLKVLKKKNPYRPLEEKTLVLCEGLKETADSLGVNIQINRIASMFTVFFSEEKVKNYKNADSQSKKLFKKMYHSFLERKIYFAPSPFEANFVSMMHSDKDIKKTILAFSETLTKIKD